MSLGSMSRDPANSGAVRVAVILAGGLGTRLRPALANCPKVLAPVAGRPFLAYLLDQFLAAGVEKVVLCTGHQGEQLRAAFGDRYRTLALHYSHETGPLGTAGALRLAVPLLDGDPVLAANGDAYCDADLSEFVRAHQTHAADAAASLLVTWVDDTARYGTVEFDDAGNVTAFREKTGGAVPGWINAGMYLLSQRLLMSVPPEQPVSIERDVFPAWVGRGLRAHPVRAPFIDIGTPESYAQAETFLARHGSSKQTGG